MKTTVAYSATVVCRPVSTVPFNIENGLRQSLSYDVHEIVHKPQLSTDASILGQIKCSCQLSSKQQ